LEKHQGRAYYGLKRFECVKELSGAFNNIMSGGASRLHYDLLGIFHNNKMRSLLRKALSFFSLVHASGFFRIYAWK
jgi:hypothetical protein